MMPNYAYYTIGGVRVPTTRMHTILQAGREFTQQVGSIWGDESGKGGVAVRTELKVLQTKVAKGIEDKCALPFPVACLHIPSRALVMPHVR
jgi:hypothetical protein